MPLQNFLPACRIHTIQNHPAVPLFSQLDHRQLQQLFQYLILRLHRQQFYELLAALYKSTYER